MREDQKARLDEISELLTEEFLNEADPREWPGAGLPPSSWDNEVRGNRVWIKRGAVATGAVIRSLTDLEDRHMKGLSKDPVTQEARDDDLDKHINRYEQQAAKLLEKVQAAGKQ